jgi:hypothetical protein
VRCASGVSCSRVWVQNGDYVDVIGFEITSLNTVTSEGLVWYGSYGLGQGNKVHDIACVGAGSNGGDGIGTKASASHITIDANLVYNIAVGSTDNTVHGIYVNATQYATVSNNLIFHNAVWGINFHHQTGSYYATVVNNTIFNNSGGINIEAKTSSYIANNILTFNTNGPHYKYVLSECCQINTGATNVYTNNLIYGNTHNTATFLDSNAVNAKVVTQDPKFVNYTGDWNGDYQLQSGSPAINAGASKNAPTSDYAGTSRLHGSGYDIGAYDYVGK